MAVFQQYLGIITKIGEGNLGRRKVFFYLPPEVVSMLWEGDAIGYAEEGHENGKWFFTFLPLRLEDDQVHVGLISHLQKKDTTINPDRDIERQLAGFMALIISTEFPEVSKKLQDTAKAYLLIKRKVRKFLKEAYEKSSQFDLGKILGDMVTFKELGYWARLYRGKALGDPEHSYYWEIYENSSHQLIGRLWENGRLQLKQSDEDATDNDWIIQDFSGGLSKTAKYIWLKRQQPLKENYTVQGNRTEYPDIGGYAVYSMTRDSYNGHPETYWNIHDEKGNNLGTLSSNGHLRYKQDKDGNLGTFEGDYIDSGNNFRIPTGPNSGILNIENAVRFLYLKNQKPIEPKVVSENSEEEVKFEDIPFDKLIAFPDVGGWTARKSKMLSEFFIIRDNKGNKKGMLIHYASKKGKTGDVAIKWGFYNDNHGGAFKYSQPWHDFRDVKNAVRFVYLQNQEPIEGSEETIYEDSSEESKKLDFLIVGELVTFPDIKDWGVMLSNFPGIIMIMSPEGTHMGTLSDGRNNNSKKSWLGYNTTLMTKLGRQGWQHTTSWDYDNVKNAVRYVFLQNQEPLKEKNISENSEEEVKFENVPLGKLITFPDIENWGAKGVKWDTINIYSNDGGWFGTLRYYEATKKAIIYYGVGEHDNWEHEEIWPIFGNVKNAVRFVYLKLQQSGLVGEITANGNEDLSNYYTKNPAALNNDYVDNFLDNQDYYISDKIANRPPTQLTLPGN